MSPRGTPARRTALTRARPGVLTAATLLALLLLLAAPGAPGAWADGDEQSADTRWAVTPADGSGRDERSSIQHALDPGESITEHIAVHNLGDREETFRLSAADGFTTSTGRFDMLTSAEESADAGTWIDIAEEVTVGAGQSEVVPLRITVPAQAEPGDHLAGVAASVLSSRSAADGTDIGVESRVGVKVTTRVTGELAPAVAVGPVSSTYEGSWNPLRPGRVLTTFEVTNEGNTRVSIAGGASAGTGAAAFPAEGERLGELLPGDTRRVSVAVDGVWPTLRLPGRLQVAPGVAALDGTTAEAEPVEVTFVTWAPPWPQLLVLIGLALLVYAVIGGRRHGRRRLDSLLAQAREEGRRSAGPTASAETSTDPATSAPAAAREPSEPDGKERAPER